jgi:hypothetical protein
MSIAELRENERFFRVLSPKELAVELRAYAESLRTDEDTKSMWDMLNIVRAADLIEEAAK